MSTTFGIPPRPVLLRSLEDDDGELHDYVNIDWFEPVFFRSMRNCKWLSPIAQYLPDDTKVYALDNSRQGIYTIKDIKKLLEHETDSQV